MTYVAIKADHNKLRKVRRALRRKGIEAYLPAIVHKRPVVKSAKVKYRRRITPLMSYILVKAPEHPAARDLWLYDIKTMKDVRGYVTIQGEPALINDYDVFGVWCQMSDILKEIALSKKKRQRWHIAGAKARLKDGPFAGRVGTIQWLNEKRAKIEVRALGGTVTVNTTVDSLEAA